MSWYAFLAATTLLVAVAALALYRRSGTIAFPVGLLLMYHLTLMGSWVIVAENRGLDVQRAGWGYTYLYEKLFPVRLDFAYGMTLALYATFLLVVAGTLLLRVRPIRGARDDAPAPLPLSHGRLLLLCGSAGAMTFLFFRARLLEALSSGASAYVLIRTAENDPTFAVGAILSRAALIPAALGFATLCSGPDARYAVSRASRPWHLAGYALLIGGMYALAATLGNKNELLTSMITGVLFYLANARRPRLGVLVVLGSTAALAIGAIELLRSAPLALIGSTINTDTAALLIRAPLMSNEIFAAHFSMYGALRDGLSLTWGSSLLVFVLSAVPRIVWPDRPPDIYAHYASGVGATEGQGYTIHHATGWYLNFGSIGVVMGAIVLAWVWSAVHNQLADDQPRPLVRRVFAVVAPWTFVAAIPGLIRSGPEGYKGLIINSLLVPTALLAVSCAVWRFRRDATAMPTTLPLPVGAD